MRWATENNQKRRNKSINWCLSALLIIDTYPILDILGVETQEPYYLLKKFINDRVSGEKGSIWYS